MHLFLVPIPTTLPAVYLTKKLPKTIIIYRSVPMCSQRTPGKRLIPHAKSSMNIIGISCCHSRRQIYDKKRRLFAPFDLSKTRKFDRKEDQVSFLKAILYSFGVDSSKTHGLKGLFEKLPQNEQEYISGEHLSRGISPRR